MAPRPSLSSILTQFIPPKPQFTDKDLPDLNGKVYIVTGANTGVGKELARFLFARNAKVYIAARSQEKSQKAIEDIVAQAAPRSTGQLKFLRLDLADLTTIKSSAEEFLSQETKLHVLFNNAGVMKPGHELERTPQGHEIHIGVNCVGHQLFTRLLTPLLASTAKSESAGTVRVVWVSSFGNEVSAHESIGIPLDYLDKTESVDGMVRYSMSKVGNYLQGVEFAKKHKADGIVSLAVNPGNLKSELYREHGIFMGLVLLIIGYPPVNGAYTELFAGISPEITLEKTGSWIVPFGRIYPVRKDLMEASKTKAEGGSGGAQGFWDWIEDQIRDYL